MRHISVLLFLASIACRQKDPGADPGLVDGDGDGLPAAYDCDDANPAAYAGAPETCDGADNDCDGLVDDDPSDGAVYYTDGDGDGAGDETDALVACAPPAGAVEDGSDCDDGNPAIGPEGEEICNGIDDDCDGLVDSGATDAEEFFLDADNDGFGGDFTLTACGQPEGFTDEDGDCDDAVATTSPVAAEVCNGVDDDCDGVSDDGITGATKWYFDYDGDGFGGDYAITSCDVPQGYTAQAGDCDDAVASTNPVGNEVCNGADDDCDGVADGGLPTSAWYFDYDGDGFGGTLTVTDCAMPDGYVASAGDCDDATKGTNPAGNEVCNGADDDCDGAADDGLMTTWYRDGDGDGFGDAAAAKSACAPPPGHVTDATDCNDKTTVSSPIGVETCDGIDNDCDGKVDDDAAGAVKSYADTDGDGFGAGAATTSCTVPAGNVANNGDCDDTAKAASPLGTELCDKLDNDCDGTVDDTPLDAATWYADGDGDGFGNAKFTQRACAQPSGYAAAAGDCNDGDKTALPGGTELCDGVDDDCDGVVDEGASDASKGFLDADGDGFGNLAFPVTDCKLPPGVVTNGKDCNDGDKSAYPGATEVCDGADDDCDTKVDEGTLGTDFVCPALDCADIRADNPSRADGAYWLDLTGGEPDLAWCDMDIAGGGWALAMNLDTSDGHVMWWANPLWTSAETYGTVDTPFVGDLKSPVWNDYANAAEILLVVHTNGAVVGWKRFAKANGQTMFEHMQGGDNTRIGTSVTGADVANVWSGERLVRISTQLYANHCVRTGGNCTTGNSGSPDGDRIGSDEGTPSDNNGGGLGNWHDMNYCCSGANYGSGKSCNGSSFRSTSEAQAGWVYSGQNNAFGSDTFGAWTGSQTDASGCWRSNWVTANNVAYDYAIYLR